MEADQPMARLCNMVELVNASIQAGSLCYITARDPTAKTFG
jgi:hypothetical protein